MNSPVPTSKSKSANNSPNSDNVPLVVHAPTTTTPQGGISAPLLPAPTPGGSVASHATNLSIDNQVSKIFETEVNKMLDECLHKALPTSKLTEFESRIINEDKVHLEMDCHAYMLDETVDQGQDCPAFGISVVVPSDKSFVPVSKPSKPSQKLNVCSPDAKQKRIPDGFDKYFLGEAYSGDNLPSVKDKVKQLEIAHKKMMGRHVDQQTNPSVRVDETLLFGGAVLCFMTPSRKGKKTRKHRLHECQLEIGQALTQANTPILYRLAQARRLFLCVLSERDAAATAALREVSSGVRSISAEVKAVNAGQAAMQGDIVSLQGEVKAVHAGQAAMQGDIESLRGQVKTIDAGQAAMQGDIETLQGRVETLQGRVEAVHAGQAAMQGYIESLRGQVNTIDAGQAAMQRDIERLQGQVKNVGEMTKMIYDLLTNRQHEDDA